MVTADRPGERDWALAALDHLREAVFVIDSQGFVQLFNLAAEHLLGRAAEGANGKSLARLLPMVEDTTGLPFPFGTPADSPRLGCLGERFFDIEVSPFQDGGRPPAEGTLVSVREVTPRVLAGRDLAASEERYRAFFEQSSVGIWRYEVRSPVSCGLPEDEQIELYYRDGYLAECNEAMAQMYGLAHAEDLVGAALGDLLPRSDPHNVEYLRSFIHSGYRLVGAESHEVDKDGNPKTFLNNLVGVIEGGALVRAWGTQLDITERKRLEEELRRRAEELAGADRRKDQFLAMLAHELRNPLAPIRNAVELMRQAEIVDPSFSASREMVERQVKHLARLVDDLLDVSRITRGSIRLRKEAVDLVTIAERAVEATRPLIEARGHHLQLDLPDRPLRLEADPTRLEQVISNLLNNAAKYTMPGGQIWLVVKSEGPEATVRVRDTGIGVPPDVLGRVFEPFVQSDGSLARSEGGLGIGLTLVRSLVEMHGGTVEAHSPGLGQGSEFVVRLPVRPGPSVAAERYESDEPASPLTHRSRVLVVEDNVDAAESLAALLRLWGHEVQVVNDGLAAIDAAREQRPEVVLLDIGLPGLDGYQVARKLREEVGLDHALLVAMTGYGQPEDRRRSQEAGIHLHYVKPVEPAILRELLANPSTSRPVTTQ
jgi:PAS domain S-box-containing protein